MDLWREMLKLLSGSVQRVYTRKRNRNKSLADAGIYEMNIGAPFRGNNQKGRAARWGSVASRNPGRSFEEESLLDVSEGSEKRPWTSASMKCIWEKLF